MDGKVLLNKRNAVTKINLKFLLLVFEKVLNFGC